MKQKVIIGGLCLTFILSFAGCGGQQAQEPPQTQDVQQTEPVPSTTPEETPTVESPAPEEETPAVESPAPEEETPALESPAPEEETPAVESPVPEEEAPEAAELSAQVPLFTDCNETVYALGTVNIRASWSANSTKLGVLTYGQSVTRTGNPIPGTEAGKWCRVCLSNGTVAYVHSDYVSTTKPQPQQPANNGGSGGQAGAQSGGSSGSGGSGGSSGYTGGGGSSGGSSGSILDADNDAELEAWLASGGGTTVATDYSDRPGAYKTEGGWTIPDSAVH